MSIEKVAILGSGIFGATIANLAAENKDVMLYSRRANTVAEINDNATINGLKINPKIAATSDIQQVCKECTLMFPVVPSKYFRSLIQDFSPYLSPQHILIHATKGLDFQDLQDYDRNDSLSTEEVFTMSEVIQQESNVVRIGALAGPNLANEILDHKPAAAVIASPFDEVIKIGSETLKSQEFYIFSSNALKGTEVVGAFKNIYALAAGVMSGLDRGKNIFGLLITRAMREMINFLTIMNADWKAALGTSGLGDLVTTASSTDSRNFKFGQKIASGMSFEEVMKTQKELAEGVRTLKAAYLLCNHYKIDAPITKLLYQIIYENLDFNRAIKFMMSYPFSEDVDFL